LRLGFAFYGIAYGAGGKTPINRDFRHCWPNIKKMLIDPFVAKGHEAKIYFSTYHIDDKEIQEEFYRTTNPDRVLFSELKGSDAFTSKGASFVNFVHDESVDAIVFCRNDIHFSKVIADGNVDFTKFNFLFREQGWWENARFTCDNFYIFPQRWSATVMKAMYETYAWPRGKPMVDTHGLYAKLTQYIPESEMHFISDVHEISDVNSYYTCCRDHLPLDGRGGQIHPEVKERFGYQ